MIETVKAWQCIGCGKIEAPQTCVGVCRDRKVEFVYAAEHEQVVGQLTDRLAALRAFARQFAGTKPHKGEWEKSFNAMQQRARRALADAENISSPAERAA